MFEIPFPAGSSEISLYMSQKNGFRGRMLSRLLYIYVVVKVLSCLVIGIGQHERLEFRRPAAYSEGWKSMENGHYEK